MALSLLRTVRLAVARKFSTVESERHNEALERGQLRRSLNSSLTQYSRNLFGEVGQDDPGSRPSDRSEGFHNDPLPVHPSHFRSGLDQGKLAANLIGSQGNVKCPAGEGDNIQIR